MAQNDSLSKSKPEAEAVADLVRKHLEPKVLELKRGTSDSAPVVALAEGVKLTSLKALLDEYRVAPERREGTARLEELNSFTDHVLRFKDDASVIFANRIGPALTAIFDYHGPTAGKVGPRFGKHRALYSFPLSDEWKAWKEKNAKPMDQASFAAFLEDRISDIADPTNPGITAIDFAAKLNARFATPARLLELSRGLGLRINSTFKNAVKLESGEVQFNYVTEHVDTAGEPITIPTAFLIGIPVFSSGVPWEIAARLRYRTLDGGRLSWAYDLYRTERIFDAAFAEACAKAKEATGLPLFVGTPE